MNKANYLPLIRQGKQAKQFNFPSSAPGGGRRKRFQSAAASLSKTMISRPALPNLANSKFKNIASRSWPCLNLANIRVTPCETEFSDDALNKQSQTGKN